MFVTDEVDWIVRTEDQVNCQIKEMDETFCPLKEDPWTVGPNPHEISFQYLADQWNGARQFVQ